MYVHTKAGVYSKCVQYIQIFTAASLVRPPELAISQASIQSDQAVVYLYNAGSLGHKKELSMEIHYKVDEYQNNYAE